MIELSSRTLGQLPAGVQRPGYDRAGVRAGIVHLSVGNFHRAHMARYIDRLLARPGQDGWGLCGVSLIDDARNRDLAEALPAQDGLYTLTNYPPDAPPAPRVIGAMVEYLFAPRDPEAALRRMVDPAIRIVSMTITEGGYNRDKSGAFQLDAPDTRAELAEPGRPRTAFGYLVEALRRRRAAGVAPFTVMSCDNLLGNGHVTRASVLAHAGALDAELAEWIAAHVAFPNAMVDGITPAVSPEDAARLNAASGIADRAPVFAEDFVQWVIEDRFCNGRPRFEDVGVQMTDDVQPYEFAKLRMLNASHSMLAYPAQLAGLSLVREALADADIRALLDQFMRLDAIPGLTQPPGMDLQAYRTLLLDRFANPALGDQLPRITGEGSVKLPLFLGPTVRHVLAQGGDHRRLAFLLACYTRYLGGVDDAGHAFTPFEPSLDPADRALALDPDPRAALRMGLLRAWGLEGQAAFADTFARLRADIAARGVRPVLQEVLRPAANQQWGGRFAAGPAAVMRDINASIGFDQRLWRQDIRGSLAHAAMLAQCGIISATDEADIRAGLGEIAAEIEAGRFPFAEALEDIHMNIEARLTERVGEAGKRLHTARSRNDQVATDFRLWVRDAIDGLDAQLADVMQALAARAAAHAADPLPGFTHLQTAQPVTFGHHCLAYVEMLHRDRGRLADCRRRLNECPLGSAALAGTSFPIDREMTARALGFDRPTANSLDAVSDRDFALEFLSAAAISAMHLSRLAEEIVIWCSAPYRFIRLSDAFTTGSSIMPQKRNPDAAELVRAKTGRVTGALVALLTVMKGLAMAYAKDMQEDKQPVFEAADAWALSLAATAGMVRDLTPDTARMREFAGSGYATATDLADWLVRVLKRPFRTAHHVTGKLVARAEARGVDLAGLSLEEMQAEEPGITAEVYSVLTVDASVASRVSHGGTAPANVAAQAQRWLEALA